MKIYDTYKLLFESDEELLDEIAWTKHKATMFTRGEIPLTPTVVRKLLGEPERIEAFHITDKDNVNEIKKIIGKRNSISAFNYFDNEMLMNVKGVQTDGGIVIRFSGIMDMESSGDIGSGVDTKPTRRWINSKYLSSNLHQSLVNYFLPPHFKNDLDSMRKHILKIYELLDYYKEDIQRNLVKLVLGNQKSEWNEVLIRNVKILDIAWVPSIIFSNVSDEETSTRFYNKLYSELQDMAPNHVYTLESGQDLVRWYHERGGYENIGQLKTDYIDNRLNKKNMLTSGKLEQLCYLINYDLKYVEDNFELVKNILNGLDVFEIEYYFHQLNYDKVGGGRLLIRAKGNDITNKEIEYILRGTYQTSIRIQLVEEILKVVTDPKLTDEIISLFVTTLGYSAVEPILRIKGKNISVENLKLMVERMDSFDEVLEVFGKYGYTREELEKLIDE